jgi:RNA polymerase sigma-70 factor, ECF subfamily
MEQDVHGTMALAKTSSQSQELDELTLRRAQRKDHAAFRALVEIYHRRVFGLLWRMTEHTLGQAHVEELTQETFLKVYQSLEGFTHTGPARLSSWILTIASRLALNELRRSASQALRQEKPAVEEKYDLVDDLHRARLRDAIRRALFELKPDQRIVLVLREYEELDYEEIASALEIDLGTVKSRLFRAREALRQALLEVSDG